MPKSVIDVGSLGLPTHLSQTLTSPVAIGACPIAVKVAALPQSGETIFILPL
ncbi:hypothetical protein JCM18900_12099 [Psychrobacter sp. JCM 18900]|nr:hypothetical protein JCM18900_12099 [Psychrobacter sp. JCM 18900]